MANSGLQNVAVFTREKHRYLIEHLGSCKDWGLSRKRGGLTILPPHFSDPRSSHEGDLNNLYAHRDIFDHGRQGLVILATGNIICNLKFHNALRFHRDHQADVTLCCDVAVTDFRGRPRRCLELAADGRVQAVMGEDQKAPVAAMCFCQL